MLIIFIVWKLSWRFSLRSGNGSGTGSGSGIGSGSGSGIGSDSVEYMKAMGRNTGYEAEARNKADEAFKKIFSLEQVNATKKSNNFNFTDVLGDYVVIYVKFEERVRKRGAPVTLEITRVMIKRDRVPNEALTMPRRIKNGNTDFLYRPYFYKISENNVPVMKPEFINGEPEITITTMEENNNSTIKIVKRSREATINITENLNKNNDFSFLDYKFILKISSISSSISGNSTGTCTGTCTRTGTGTCVDLDQQCSEWVKNGECLKNKPWMESNCCKSCSKFN